MRYLDTSVLLAFLLPEAGSRAAWTEIELMSALGIKGIYWNKRQYANSPPSQ